MAAEDLGVWVYALARADRAQDRTAGLRGVAGEPVRAVVAGDLAAVVGTVELDEFRGAGLRRNFSDADWFAAKARAHNAVVSAVRRGGSVFPVRPATIYRDDWRVCQLLSKEHEEIQAALRRISGREELGVKVYADPKSMAVQGDLRRRRQLASQYEGYRMAVAEADRVHTALMRCAVEGKRKPSPNGGAEATGPSTILNGSYLVDDDGVELFVETITALERSTARIKLEVTGPWPPYSFAEDMIAI